MKKESKILLSVFVILVASIMLIISGLGTHQNPVFAQSSSLTIISLSSDNKLIGGSQFLISPNPFTGTGNYTIKDNSSDDVDKDKDGVITLSGVKNGNYVIIQTSTASGYNVDQI